MSRRIGEKNWGEDADTYRLHTPLPPQTRKEKRQRLMVEVLTASPPSYLVRDEKGNQWEIVTGADNELEIIERPDDTYQGSDKRAIKAVQRYRTN